MNEEEASAYRSEYDQAIALKDKAVEIAIAIGFEHNKMVKERDQALADDAKTQAALEHVRGLLDSMTLERDKWRDEYQNLCKFATQYEQERDRLKVIIKGLLEWSDVDIHNKELYAEIRAVLEKK